jgi:hypothetical protein
MEFFAIKWLALWALKFRAPLEKNIFIPNHKVSFYGGRLCGE